VLDEPRVRAQRLLVELMPDEAEAHGLLALLLLTESRRAARADAEGRLVRLGDQDRVTLICTGENDRYSCQSFALDYDQRPIDSPRQVVILTT
jgi:hypothetical protein